MNWQDYILFFFLLICAATVAVTSVWGNDRPVILGECRTDSAKYYRMKLGIQLGYKWVEAVPSNCDEGGCRVIVGHTTTRGREKSANETLGK
ncbi:MAG TPA: hypothetical protein VFQ43_19915 [Nitrososphaera sp.]|nr:hypothetical protein [Nitrososphaera sp.]